MTDSTDVPRELPDFLPGSGACIVSKNILSGRAPLKWGVRNEPNNPADTGWIFDSQIDDDTWAQDINNYSIVPFSQVVALEPIVLALSTLPVGADIQVVSGPEEVSIIDNHTGEQIGPELPPPWGAGIRLI